MSGSILRDGTISNNEKVGFWGWLIIGGVFAVWTVVAAVIRIVEVIPNRDVAVYAEFGSTVVDAPIGPNGSSVPVEMTAGWITVPTLQPIGIIIIVIQQVLFALCVLAFIACLVIVSLHVLRGRVFSVRNTVLVSCASGAVALGYFSHVFFGNMASNAAFARVSDYTFDNVIQSADLAMVFAGAFVATLAITTFAVGDRLQRDTKGLV